MSKTKLALNVVEDLKQLASSIETLVKTMESNEEAPAPKVSSITLEQVRAVLAEKSQAGKQPQVKALIKKFGADKLTQIPEDRYEELLKEVEGI
jgi:hypothetical protein